MAGRPKCEIVALALLGAAVVGCNRIATQALDQAAPRDVDDELVAAIQVPDGFRAASVVDGLNYPSSMTWDAEGQALRPRIAHGPGARCSRRGSCASDRGDELDEVELEGARRADRRAGDRPRVP